MVFLIVGGAAFLGGALTGAYATDKLNSTLTLALVGVGAYWYFFKRG